MPDPQLPAPGGAPDAPLPPGAISSPSESRLKPLSTTPPRGCTIPPDRFDRHDGGLRDWRFRVPRTRRERTPLEAAVWRVVEHNRAHQGPGPRSLSDVARLLGLAPQTLSAYLAGTRAVRPAGEMRGTVTIEALAVALGVEPAALTGALAGPPYGPSDGLKA